MVELIVYPSDGNKKLINNSPFCSKTEIFLKLAGINYVLKEFKGDPGKFSNGKLPVIKHKNEIIVDSTFIEKYLAKEFDIDLNKHLSKRERATGFAFAKMLEEYLYWPVLYERWFIDKNWARLRDGYFSEIPRLIRGPVTNFIRKKTRKSAIGQGVARHSEKDILSLGFEGIEALSNFLSQKKFLLGETVSSYDTTAYAFVATMLHSTLGPECRAEAEKHTNLVEYDKRMFELVFGKDKLENERHT